MKATRRFLNALVIAVGLSAVGQAVIIYQLHRLEQIITGGVTSRRPATLPPVPVEPVSLDGATLKGTKSASVVVIEFADFECRYCGQFANQVWPVLERDYVVPGKVLFAFRHFPLSRHAQAFRAAQAAECAGREGRFWEMYMALFRGPEALAGGNLDKLARVAGLDLPRFEACLNGEPAQVLADVRIAHALGVSSTPTFLVGQRRQDGMVRVTARIQGVRPMSEFKNAIDSATEAR